MTGLCPWIWKHDYTLQNLDKMPHGESTFEHHVTTFPGELMDKPMSWTSSNSFTERYMICKEFNHWVTYPLFSIRSSSVSLKIISFSHTFAFEHRPNHQDHCYCFCFHMLQFPGPDACLLKEWLMVLQFIKKKALKMGVDNNYSHIGGISPSEWGRLAFMWMSTRYHTGSENLWNLGPI